jgi:predicted SprT family Zn-dependent metalloprotease
MNVYAAARLAKQLMVRHKLIGWRFTFDKAARRFGQCSYHLQTITISEPLVVRNSEEEVRDTILHEIAHALVGAGHGHDAVWKNVARQIGARPEAYYDADSVTAVEGKWIGLCKCGIGHERLKMIRKLTICTNCLSRGLNPTIFWKRR